MIGEFNDETDALAMLRSKLWHREILQLADAGDLGTDTNIPLSPAIRAEFEAILSKFDINSTEVGKLRAEVTCLREDVQTMRNLILEQHRQIISLLQQRSVSGAFCLPRSCYSSTRYKFSRPADLLGSPGLIESDESGMRWIC